MTEHDDGMNRRKVLECMAWAGTGVLWTITGGVPASLGIIDEALARRQSGTHLRADQRQPHRLRQAGQPQCDGHAEEAIARVKTLPAKPAFMLHTGDITHLSKPAEFDDADQIISQPG